MVDVVSWSVDGRIGIVSVNYPPVNALSAAVRRGLTECFSACAADPDVEAIVLICEGRTFIAGADISEFDKPDEEPTLHAVFDIIENGAKPVVAAIHGSALGGGLETALICPYRIAVPSAKLGLPEVKLGLLPGAGGTQRLPRLIGAEAALDLIVTGRAISAPEALTLGLVDALAGEGRLRDDAVAYARAVLAEGRSIVRVRDRNERIDIARQDPALFERFREHHAAAMRGLRAPENIVKAVEAAVNLPFDEGIKREWELFLELVDSTEAKAQRYFFFAERATAKIPDLPKGMPVATIDRVAVIGAGTMGGGIAMNFLNAGSSVTLVDRDQASLDRGVALIRKNYESTARKGRLTPEDLETRMALLTSTLDLGLIAEADLVIEAAFEEMDVKRALFREIDSIAKDGAILATNTSFLDVNEIAAVTDRPDHVVGLHFFSPANVMRLLEVVRAERTDLSVLATAMSVARRIGKVPVVSGVCHGFIANRLMNPRGHQADALVVAGPSPDAVDRALVEYGFSMGHFQMMDLVGLDVIGRGSADRTLTGDLVALGRLGQKQGGGFYDYDEKRRPTPSPVAARVIADFARDARSTPRGEMSSEDILAWMLFPVVNEGAKILEEGIALRASDIDVAAILGYNWPAHTGGPMFWADTVGLPKIVARLQEWQATYGDYYAPARLLEQRASKGGSLTRA
jgi:3-hydroxyacyl-CoA dehydrogenase